MPEKKTPDENLTEYLVPVFCAGIRYARVRAKNAVEAGQLAKKNIESSMRYSEFRPSRPTYQALAPELELKPEDRLSWPYWRYGWHGADGVDWSWFRTDQGIASIPGMAEEYEPIPPFKD